MMRKLLITLFGALLWATSASAQIIGTLPFTLQNGTIADANQVMSDFNTIVAAVNANAATAGVNTNITALNGLTTPLSYTSGGSSWYVGGTSSNISNAYTIASPLPSGFTLVQGKTVAFIVNAGNNGATTLAVNGTTVTNFFKITPTGAVAMTGGELLTGMVAVAYFDGTQFQCLNCYTPQLVPTGTTVDYSGVTVPSGWVAADGSTYSRTTFSTLFNALAFTSVSATTTGSSTSVVVPNSNLFQVGWSVGGSNVTCNSTISSIPDGTHIVLNNAAGAGGATTLTIGPYQQGDCSTTFNVPNYRGKFLAGVDSGAGNITSATCTNTSSIGDKISGSQPCGNQLHTLTVGEMPAHTHVNSLTDPGHTHAIVGSSGTGGGIAVVNGAAGTFAQNNLTASSTTGVTITNQSQGGGSAHSILNPTSLVYKIIKT